MHNINMEAPIPVLDSHLFFEQNNLLVFAQDFVSSLSSEYLPIKKMSEYLTGGCHMVMDLF